MTKLLDGDVAVITGDRDAFQLVDERVTVLYPRKGVSDLARMTPEAVMDKYVKPDAFTIIVIAPAAAVKESLQKLGDVEVRPMPSVRGATTKPATKEMLKPAA